MMTVSQHSDGEVLPQVRAGRTSRRWPIYALGTLLGLGLAAGGLAIYTGQIGDNFREVSSHKYYRSAQLSPQELKRHVQEYGIRCVVSVRGGSDRAAWYRDEKQACQELNCAHAAYDVRLGRLPEPKELAGLVQQLEEGPYPMLVHCKKGADRAALAAVFYLVIVEHKPLNEALAAQLTWRYGHVRAGGAASIDDFFDLYRAASGGMDLKSWVKDAYPDLYRQRYPRIPGT
ncbi:MAG: tyrosine-protein phosphatase [Planctomycetota bacterium]